MSKSGGDQQANPRSDKQHLNKQARENDVLSANARLSVLRRVANQMDNNWNYGKPNQDQNVWQDVHRISSARQDNDRDNPSRSK